MVAYEEQIKNEKMQCISMLNYYLHLHLVI